MLELRSPARGPGEGLVGSSAPQTFLQAGFWAAFKEGFGWKALSFELRHSGFEGLAPGAFPLRVLIRRLAGPLSFAYVPGGPAVDCPPGVRPALLAELAQALSRVLPPSCLFLRFDPPWYESELPPAEDGGGVEGERLRETDHAPAVARPLFGRPLLKSGSDVQPPDSVLLDLGPTEADLLAGMKPKWRYNIRLAEKKGVTVEEEGRAGLPTFYALYEETSRRDRIAIHPLAYYEALFGAPGGVDGEPPPDLRLWVARHEGEAIASIITLFFGKSATYLYGASSDSKRSLMPAYALQWAAIRAAREAGCGAYDFYGIPPTAQPGHPMEGLYRFKTGFGGAVVHYPGSWDYPLNPVLYSLWRGAEAARAWWFKKAMKRLRGLLGRRG